MDESDCRPDAGQANPELTTEPKRQVRARWAVEQSKGRKDRNVMLSPETLDLLRQWWKTRRRGFDSTTPVAERWLFPGQRPGKPMTTRQLNRLFHQAADAAGCSRPPRKGATGTGGCPLPWPCRGTA